MPSHSRRRRSEREEGEKRVFGEDDLS